MNVEHVTRIDLQLLALDREAEQVERRRTLARRLRRALRLAPLAFLLVASTALGLVVLFGWGVLILLRRLDAAAADGPARPTW